MSRGRFSKHAAGPLAFRTGLAAKSAIALAAFVALRIALAQAPSGPPVVQDAQGYSVLTPFATWANPKGKGAEQAARSKVRQMLSGQIPMDRVQFDFYYTMYYFPMMTQTTDETLKVMPEERQRFFRDHLEYSGRTLPSHAALIGLALPEMTKIVTGTFHPACRYNAMLIIGGLNEVEPSRLVQPYTTPEPMAKALPIIWDTYKKCVKPEEDSLKLAALLGLTRHLEWDAYRAAANPNAIQPAMRKEIVDEMLKLAQMKDPSTGRDADGHVWFRRRAVEALGCSCSTKADAAIVSALDAILRNEKEPLPLRLTVATTLGKMLLADQNTPATVDPKSTATELGYLALVACETELNRLADLKKTEEEHMIRLAGQLPGEFGAAGLAGGPTASGPRGEGFGSRPPGAGPGLSALGPGGSGVRPAPGVAPGAGGFGEGGPVDPSLIDPKHYRFEYARRRLRQQLYCVQIGLLGGDDIRPATAAPMTPVIPKAGGGPTSGSATPPPATTGVRAIAKAPDAKTYVEDVYAKVRDMAEIIENRVADIPSLDKELRRKMKPLEDITRKLAPPPAAAAATATDDDDLLNPGGAKPATPMPMPPAGTAPAPMPPAAPAPMPPPAGAPMPPATAPMPPVGTAPAPMPPAATPPAPIPAAAPPGKAG